MLSTALALIDRLISLKREKDKNKRKLFLDHIEPLFNDLAIIHADYINALGDLENELKNDQTRGALRDLIIDKKLKFEAIRVKAHSALKAGWDWSDDSKWEAGDFYTSCLKYFRVQSGEVKGPYKAYFTDLLAYVEGKDSYYKNDEDVSPLANEEITLMVIMILKDLRIKWEEVTLSYSICKKNYLL